MKAVFLTGCSSGIGHATALLFQKNGWTVFATMRNPNAAKDLATLENVHVLALDVTDPNTVRQAITAAEAIQPIDVLVNNAGYGAYGPLESTPTESIERLFKTNLLGLIDVTRAVLPHLRKRGTGTIINVSSLGGRTAWPLGSLYHASKFAIEGLSEALLFELEAAGINIKVVQPGRVATDFNGRSVDINVDPAITEYQPVIQALMASATQDHYRTEPQVPAEVIFTAATDGTKQFRYPSGNDAVEGLQRRRELSDEAHFAEIRSTFGLDRA